MGVGTSTMMIAGQKGCNDFVKDHKNWFFIFLFFFFALQKSKFQIRFNRAVWIIPFYHSFNIPERFGVGVYLVSSRKL